MAVYKRGAKSIFYMNFTVNGQRIFKSTGKYTKREAKYVEALEKQKLVNEAALTPNEKVGKMLLSEAIEQTYKARWKNIKTADETYKQAYRLVDFLGDRPLQEINQESFEQFVELMDERKVTIGTVNRYLATLKTVLRYKKQEWDFIKLRKERKGRLRTISPMEEATIINMLRTGEHPVNRLYRYEMADLVELLIDTGMRLGEALNITYSDINYSTKMIHIWVNKADRPRSIPMTRRVKAMLERRHTIGATKVFLLTKDQSEQSWKWVRKHMGLVGDKEFVIHALRHTCASRLVNAGIDLYVVKEWLGHSSIQVTERYAHLSPAKLLQAVEVLDTN